MTQDDIFATKRLALLSKRDTLIKQQHTLQESLTAQTESLSDLCTQMTELVLSAEARIAEKSAEIATLADTLRQAQADNKRQQTEIMSLRREIATLKKSALPPPAEDDAPSKRAKSLQRAVQKQRKDQFAHQHALEKKISELTELLSAKDKQIQTLQAKWEESQSRYLALMERERAQQDELLRLRPVPPAPEVIKEEEISDDIPYADPLITELNRLSRTLVVSVIGGSPTWQKKAAESFPHLRFLGNQDFDGAKLLTTDILLVNTNHVSHSCTKKAVDLATAQSAEVCYTSKHNLSQIAELLCERIQTILS